MNNDRYLLTVRDDENRLISHEIFEFGFTYSQESEYRILDIVFARFDDGHTNVDFKRALAQLKMFGSTKVRSNDDKGTVVVSIEKFYDSVLAQLA